jgi:AcrR family transcriptional regulator
MEPDAKTSRRDLIKAQNRETILTAARQVFGEMGFAAASVRDVIRATPLASGTFYNYFKSKEEVYQALRDEVALAIRPRLREERRRATTAQEFLTGSFCTFFEFAVRNRGPHPAAEVSRIRMDSPEVLGGFAELRDDLQSAIGHGLFPDVDADLLMAAMAGVALQLAQTLNDPTDVDTASAFAAALFMGGIPALPLNGD